MTITKTRRGRIGRDATRRVGPTCMMRALPTLAGLAVAAMLFPSRAARADDPPPLALLIANSGIEAQAVLGRCIPAMQRLADRLMLQGIMVTEAFDADGPTLRAAIGRFDAKLGRGQRGVIAFCGYGQADADKLFLLPAHVVSPAAEDLPRHAVIGLTLTRILADHDAVLVAEVHDVPQTAPLAPAIRALRLEAAPQTHVALRTVQTPGAAPLIDEIAAKEGAIQGIDWAALTHLVDAAGVDAPAPVASLPPAATSASAALSSLAQAAQAGAQEQAQGGWVQAGPGQSGWVQAVPTQGVPPAALSHAQAEPPAPTRTVLTDARPGPKALPAASASPGAAVTEPSVGTGAATGAGSGTGPAASSPGHRARAHDPGSDTIRRVQVALLAKGFYDGAINGEVTADTKESVKRYQASLKQPQTGILNYAEYRYLVGGD